MTANSLGQQRSLSWKWLACALDFEGKIRVKSKRRNKKKTKYFPLILSPHFYEMTYQYQSLSLVQTVV